MDSYENDQKRYKAQQKRLAGRDWEPRHLKKARKPSARVMELINEYKD